MTDKVSSEDFIKAFGNGVKDNRKIAHISDEKNKGDLISRSALVEHKFLTPQVKVIGGRRCGKTREQIIEAYQKGWNDCIDAIINNAQTVAEDYDTGYQYGLEDGLNDIRPQGEWIRLDLAKRVIAKFEGYLDEDMIERIQIALEKENEAEMKGCAE